MSQNGGKLSNKLLGCMCEKLVERPKCISMRVTISHSTFTIRIVVSVKTKRELVLRNIFFLILKKSAPTAKLWFLVEDDNWWPTKYYVQ